MRGSITFDYNLRRSLSSLLPVQASPAQVCRTSPEGRNPHGHPSIKQLFSAFLLWASAVGFNNGVLSGLTN
jgi:hypothetical protein